MIIKLEPRSLMRAGGQILLACSMSLVLLGWPAPVAADSPGATFGTSLHATRAGKETYYSNPITSTHPIPMGGFENLTEVPYDDLVCKKCHGPTYADGTPVDDDTYMPGCRDCHAGFPVSEYPVEDSTCLGCHSRQRVERMFFSDVHRDMDFGCMDCHVKEEMHGDGTAYASLQEPGAIKTRCTNCHDEAALEPHRFHQHTASVDCSACHVQSVITCNSCHFESELAGVKRWYVQTPSQGFKFLGNKDGKVKTFSYQSLTFEGQTHYVLAPYTAHSITLEGIKCRNCHEQGGGGGKGLLDHPLRTPINEYVQTGKITVTRWDDGTKMLDGPRGTIPIPPDWKEALQFDFVTYIGDLTAPPIRDPSLWRFLKSGPDMVDMPYGEPLTEEQMEALIYKKSEGKDD